MFKYSKLKFLMKKKIRFDGPDFEKMGFFANVCIDFNSNTIMYFCFNILYGRVAILKSVYY